MCIGVSAAKSITEGTMIDHTKFIMALEDYKKAFNVDHWHDECYKWKAVKTFQDNWDIDADDFLTMFTKATANTKNLLTSYNFYPRGMIREFIQADKEAVRSAFVNLFDEEQSLASRIEKFSNDSEALRKKYNTGSWRNHYQNHNAITTYLWLRYPDKYYIYKYALFRTAATALNSDYAPIKRQQVQNVTDEFKFYDEIRAGLKSDTQLVGMLNGFIDKECYPDPEYITLTIDFGYFLGTGYASHSLRHDIDIANKLSCINWDEVLDDTSLTGDTVKRYIKYWYDQPSHAASCTEIAAKYGESPSVYTATLTQYAKSVLEKYNITISDESGSPVYWRALMTGDERKYDGKKVFEWTLRPEIVQVLDRRFAKQTNAETSASAGINHWWLNANPKIWSFSSIDIGKEQYYTLYNDKENKRRIFSNFLRVKAGDIIIGYESTPIKKIVGLGRITSASDGKQIGFVKTESLANPIEYSDLKNIPELADMEFFVNPNGSLFKLTGAEFNCIMDLIREQNPIDQVKNKEKYTAEDFLNEVFMSEKDYRELLGLLLNKQNIILQGAPGVGKTFTAKRLAYSIMGEKDDDRIELVQFHQSYSYEDFVMGYRPNGDGFTLKEGKFYRFCRKAASRPDMPFFFIIDEINRGNISRIFGELLMLIEKDYRGTEIELTYGDVRFSIPKNIYIIGMMNTADRSLALMDYALRRRFGFFEMKPAFESDRFKAYQQWLRNDRLNALINMIKELNADITSDASLGSGFCIGHSYFCNQNDCTDTWLKQVVSYDIIPLLAEYWFDDTDKLHSWESKLAGVFDDKE